MAVWDLFVDESYNTSTFCVGGFFAPPSMWKAIAKDWRERLAYENRRSQPKGFAPIPRYHATDCSGLKKEFDPKNGWDIRRQILFVKRLCRIIGTAGPVGIVVGGRIQDISKYLDLSGNDPKEALYNICFRTLLLDVEQIVEARFAGTEIRVVFDDSENFGACARLAFKSIKDEYKAIGRSDMFAELVAADSRNTIELQPADLITYEGFRRLDGVRRGKNEIRKSLQAMLKLNIPVHITHFTDANFADMVRSIENKKEGRLLADGITSKMTISLCGLDPMDIVVDNDAA